MRSSSGSPCWCKPSHKARQIGFSAGQVSWGGFDIKSPLERPELSDVWWAHAGPLASVTNLRWKGLSCVNTCKKLCCALWEWLIFRKRGATKGPDSFCPYIYRALRFHTKDYHVRNFILVKKGVGTCIQTRGLICTKPVLTFFFF